MEGFDGPGWPLLWEVDELISQIPTLPPMVPGRGVVGHYIDRCIIVAKLAINFVQFSLICTHKKINIRSPDASTCNNYNIKVL